MPEISHKPTRLVPDEDIPQAWFHCGRCGALFESHVGIDLRRHCPTCGEVPSFPQAESTDRKVLGARGQRSKAIPKSQNRRSIKGRGKAELKIWVVVIACWFLVLGGLGALVFKGFLRARGKGVSTVVESEEESKRRGETAFLNSARDACVMNLQNFLKMPSQEVRDAVLYNPEKVSRKISQSNTTQLFALPETASWKTEKTGVVYLPTGKAVEMLFSGENGAKYDAVFIRQDGIWRLDWENFARYSAVPWPLFLAGAEETEQDFRLFARLREETDKTKPLSIALYAPVFGTTSVSGNISPIFTLDRESTDGRMLAAAFESLKSGTRIYGSSAINPDPIGRLRVQVRIRRGRGTSDERFKITKVIACHWLGIDDTGVRLPEN